MWSRLLSICTPFWFDPQTVDHGPWISVGRWLFGTLRRSSRLTASHWELVLDANVVCSGCQVQKISSHEKKVRCCYFRSLATALINMSLHSQCLQKFLTPNLELLHIYVTYFTYHAKVFSVQFSHDSTLLLTASMDGSARTCRFNVAVCVEPCRRFWGSTSDFCKRIDCHRLPGFPTFRRVKTRSSSQAKMNPDFAASSCGTCGTCGTVGGHTDWLRCAAFSPDSLKATAQMWMNWMNMEQKGQVESWG